MPPPPRSSLGASAASQPSGGPSGGFRPCPPRAQTLVPESCVPPPRTTPASPRLLLLARVSMRFQWYLRSWIPGRCAALWGGHLS
jgi:hypothetical protein